MDGDFKDPQRCRPRPDCMRVRVMQDTPSMRAGCFTPPPPTVHQLDRRGRRGRGVARVGVSTAPHRCRAKEQPARIEGASGHLVAFLVVGSLCKDVYHLP